MNKEKIEELITRLTIEDKLKSEKTKNIIYTVLAVLGCLAVVGACAYAVYRFFKPEYIEDFEDDFDDDFDDYFEDEDYDDVLDKTQEAAKEVEPQVTDGEA